MYIYIYIYIYVCVKTKKTKEMGVSAKTAIKQVANNGRYKKGRSSIGNWKALMGLYWDF